MGMTAPGGRKQPWMTQSIATNRTSEKGSAEFLTSRGMNGAIEPGIVVHLVICVCSLLTAYRLAYRQAYRQAD